MKNYLYKVACEHFAFGLTISVNVIWQLSRGLTLSQASLIEAIALAVRFILDVPTGHLSDRFGRKPVLVTASLLFALGYGVLSQAQSFWWFLVAALLSAIGFALMSGSEEALVTPQTTAPGIVISRSLMKPPPLQGFS
ncbi:MAG TPA: MFS transporter [Candidatus Saccharimonadia bacterium]